MRLFCRPFPLVAPLAWLVAMVAAGCRPSSAVEDDTEVRTEPVSAAAAPPEQPVILLTGFEPFGAGRPPNASWEGIAGLDGRTWKEYRLASRRLRVIWGAPMEQLEQAISEVRPAAVFAFGQGLPGAMALETRASNQRGNERDNRGDLPPGPTVVPGGPDVLRATADCDRLARALRGQGYPVRVSTDAGRYLCEETLYALEHLKAKRGLPFVLFCHVPPLDSAIGSQKITAEYVRRFVLDLLEAWHATSADTPTRAAAKQPPADDPRVAEVEELIRRYFRTWSNQDLKGYGECFMPGACVQFIGPNGQLEHSDLAPFLASQAECHRVAPHRMIETPQTIDIRIEARLARAVVYWKLSAGPRTEFGYDHFTLMKHRGQWRIVNLVFYGTKPE
jgi:pyrrolidone-carboxylate peptidase